jgi:type III secretory pathway component EscV
VYKQFVKGFAFGAGFCVAALLFSLGIKMYENYFGEEPKRVSDHSLIQDEANWHKLNQEEQIAATQALLVITYKDGEEGLQIAYIDQVITKEGISTHYQVGEQYPNMNYYPTGRFSKRSGAVVFLSGNPPTYRHGLYVYENRVAGYGDMPLEILIKKVKN